MGFWDFIKSKLLGKNVKALPEGIKEIDYGKFHKMRNNFNESLSVGYTPEAPKGFVAKEGTIEFAIQQYMYGVMMQHKNGQPFNSYQALTGICGLETKVAGNNAVNENNLINRITNDGRAKLHSQIFENSDKVAFRHVLNGRSGSDADTRLYINCKRENVAALAEKFYEEFGSDPYYFKFNSDQQADGTRRSEQFVFYVGSNPHELNRIIQTIEKTRRKNPQLFEGSKYMNPFMRDLKGYIAYAPNVKTPIYHALDGIPVGIDASYNSLLGAALSDSLLTSIKDIVDYDDKLSKLMVNEYRDNLQPYINNVFEQMLENPEQQKQLIVKMKKNLERCSQKNSLLSIKGIDLEKGESSK